MLINPECEAQRPISDKLQECVLCPWVTPKQVHRFGEHRLANEERSVEFVESFGDPTVVSFRPIKKSHQWSGINDGYVHCLQSPRDAWDSKPDQEPRN